MYLRKNSSYNHCSYLTTILLIRKTILSIELDGHYHKYTQDKDKRRDELLKSAGIPVIRFKEIPDIKVIRKTISRYI